MIWFKRLTNPAKFNFKDEYRWWYSIELGRRFVAVLMTVPFPKNIVRELITSYYIMTILSLCSIPVYSLSA